MVRSVQGSRIYLEICPDDLCLFFLGRRALTLLMPGTRKVPGFWGSLISFTKTYSAEEAVRHRGEAVLDGDSIRKQCLDRL